jgi:hypothetical protein
MREQDAASKIGFLARLIELSTTESTITISGDCVYTFRISYFFGHNTALFLTGTAIMTITIHNPLLGNIIKSRRRKHIITP